MTTEELKQLSPADLSLMWNRYCYKSNFLNEYDYVLLNEDRTYVEAFENEEQAMKEILNSSSPDFKRNTGYLITLLDEKGYYKGMRWIPEEDIWDYVDFDLMAD